MRAAGSVGGTTGGPLRPELTGLHCPAKSSPILLHAGATKVALLPHTPPLPQQVPEAGAGAAQELLTLDLVQVTGLFLGEQGRVGILPGIHLVNKEGAEPAAFSILGIETVGQTR